MIGIYTCIVGGKRYSFEESQLEYHYIENANKHAGDFIGQTKKVWYNPESPGQSFPFPAVTVMMIVTLIGGLMAVIIGGYFFVHEAPRKKVEMLYARFES